MYLRSEFWDANAKKERKRKREEKKEWRGKEEKGGKVHHASKLASSRIAVCWNCRSLRASGCWSVGSSLPDQFLRPKSICRSRRVSLLLYRATDRQPPMRNARTSVDKQQQMTFLANYFHPLPSFLVPSLLFQSAGGELRIYRNSFYFGKLSKHENIFFFVRLNLNHDFEVWNLPFATIPRNMPHDFCFPHFYQTLSIKFKS